MTIVFYLVFAVLLPQPVAPGCTELPGNNVNPQQIGDIQQCRIHNHYAPFILIGILAWNFTAGSVLAGMSSLLGNSSIIKKVYFPREVLPIAAVLAQFVNFLLALIPLFVVCLISGVIPSWYSVILPVVFLAHIMFLVGLAMLLSVTVLYLRDLNIIMEVVIQAWFFLSPVIYTMNQVYGDGAKLVYWLNPVASFIEMYRAVLFFDYPPGLDFTLRTIATGFGTFVIGYAVFIWKRKKIGEML